MTKESDYAARLRGWIGHPACPAQSVQDDLRAGADEIERLNAKIASLDDVIDYWKCRAGDVTASEPSECSYESEDGDTLTYDTGCGNIFRLDPMLELYEFCPYCGKRVAVKSEERPCTCHPDDNPPRPCPRKYALSECRKAAAKSGGGYACTNCAGAGCSDCQPTLFKSGGGQ